MYAQADLILYRDGSEKEVKLIQVSKDEVVYSISSKGSPVIKDDIKDIYMLRYSKRGNVYITPEGKRITGENHKIDKNADLIYLIEGGLIQAYNLQILSDIVKYESQPQGGGLFGKKQQAEPLRSLDLNKIFLIQYKDGTKDIITDLSQSVKKEGSVGKDTQSVPVEGENPVSEKKVIFHNVKNGETLALIAQRYHVTINEIIEWNDLPKNLKPNAKLKPEMQLMLYVHPQMSI